MEVGSNPLFLAEIEGTFPDAVGAGMIVVARDRVDGHAEFCDRAESCRDRGAGRRRRVEEIAGDDDKPGLPLADDRPDTTNRLEPLLLDAGPLGRIGDPGERLAELPV
jgi:hypothetical protein